MVRDRPYREDVLDRMRTAEWLDIPPTLVALCELIPTQECVVIDRVARLLAGKAPECGDPYGHAIRHDGRLYIHDGHHRWAIAWLGGDDRILVRIADENGCQT